MKRLPRAFKPVVLAVLVLLLLSLPGAGLEAAQQPQGFILLSAGKDGAIGTGDDIYVTGKGEAVKGKVDLAALGLTQAELVPSSEAKGGSAPVFVPASVVVTADRGSAPADGRTAVTVTAEVRGQDGGLAPDGTEVTFTTTLGKLSSVMVKTCNGLASASLVSDTSGTAWVSASVGGVTSNAVTVEFVGITNLALSKSYRKSYGPAASFPDSSGQEFTDGKTSNHFKDGLSFGYTAADLGAGATSVGKLEITVDLGDEFVVNRVELYSGSSPCNGYTYHYGADVLEVLVSTDGASFTSTGRIGTLGADQNYLTLQFSPVQARYVKFHIEKKFGTVATYRNWLFVSEGRVLGY